jgi:hypothetical protein
MPKVTVEAARLIHRAAFLCSFRIKSSKKTPRSGKKVTKLSGSKINSITILVT